MKKVTILTIVVAGVMVSTLVIALSISFSKKIAFSLKSSSSNEKVSNLLSPINHSADAQRTRSNKSTTSKRNPLPSDSSSFHPLPQPKKSKSRSTPRPSPIPNSKLRISNDEDNHNLANYKIHAFAIGDWGSTVYKPGSCCNTKVKLSHLEDTVSMKFKMDYWSQSNIAYLMGISANKVKPHVIIGHGDNFYWNGLGKNNYLDRFEETFEKMYNHDAIRDVPWINVLGNHDLGGANFICGDEDLQWRECNTTEQMEDALRLKFTMQKDYKSYNNDRWKLLDHYYTYKIDKGDVSMEIFNVDTNWADIHGSTQICCQCYGYRPRELNLTFDCNNITVGHQYCANGSRTMYSACEAIIKEWWDISIVGIKKDLAASKATFKIVNSHYSPHYHMGEHKSKIWFDILREGKPQVWINGHTHAENHDYHKYGTHFFENGAGGGIESEGAKSAVGIQGMTSIWMGEGTPYGFFQMAVSKKFLKIEFVTFADDWVYNVERENITKGTERIAHCWIIPVDGSRGHRC